MSSLSDVSASTCVVDGGMLLHKIKWLSQCKYKDVLQQYVPYIKCKCDAYETVRVVFDGYSTGSTSIKSQEHELRTGGMSANIIISPEMDVTTSADSFLRNPYNKQQQDAQVHEQSRICGIRNAFTC